jgi:hypothetical protein
MTYIIIMKENIEEGFTFILILVICQQKTLNFAPLGIEVDPTDYLLNISIWTFSRWKKTYIVERTVFEKNYLSIRVVRSHAPSIKYPYAHWVPFLQLKKIQMHSFNK